jgi:beta-N-acetylhexosaminidase
MSDDALGRAAAAVLFPGFVGHEVPDWLRAWLDRGLGGVCLFSRNVADSEQLAALTALLRAGRDDVLVGIDEEGGDVTRLELSTGSSYPGAWALGVVDDVELTERVGASIGADLAAVGVNLNFAPVADVNTNPDNPVIGIRAFGADAGLAARHVAAFVRGHEATGVAACAKHFPGHGDTHEDSHLALPTLDGGAAALDLALEPFRAAIEAGVRSVMTAHIRVPAIDDVPATLSPPILQGLLRGELGFEGVIVTDALEMRGVSQGYGVAEAAVLALAAGADALLLGAELFEEAVERLQAAIVAAVHDGRVPEERLLEAAGRVSALGRWASEPRAGAADRSVGATVAERALFVDGDVRIDRPPLVVELLPQPGIAAGPADHDLASLLQARRPDAESLTLHDWPAVHLDGDGRRLVVVTRDAHRHAWQRAAVESLLRDRPDGVVVETGLPFWRPDGGSGYVATNGAGRVNLEAAVTRLVG